MSRGAKRTGKTECVFVFLCSTRYVLGHVAPQADNILGVVTPVRFVFQKGIDTITGALEVGFHVRKIAPATSILCCRESSACRVG